MGLFSGGLPGFGGSSDDSHGPTVPWSKPSDQDPDNSHGPRVPWSKPEDPNDSHGPKVPWATSGSATSKSGIGGMLSGLLSKIFGRK